MPFDARATTRRRGDREAPRAGYRDAPARPVLLRGCRARPTTGCCGSRSASVRAVRTARAARSRCGSARCSAVESALTNGVGEVAVPPGAAARSTSRTTTPLPYGMRRPITSSFPSGHAATAFIARHAARDGHARGARLLHARRPRGRRAVSTCACTTPPTSSAGAALGLALGSAARGPLSAIDPRSPESPPRARPASACRNRGR